MLGFLRKIESNDMGKTTKDNKKNSVIDSMPLSPLNNSPLPLEIQLLNKVNSIPELNNCVDQAYIQRKLNWMPQ